MTIRRQIRKSLLEMSGEQINEMNAINGFSACTCKVSVISICDVIFILADVIV